MNGDQNVMKGECLTRSSGAIRRSHSDTGGVMSGIPGNLKLWMFCVSDNDDDLCQW